MVCLWSKAAALDGVAALGLDVGAVLVPLGSHAAALGGVAAGRLGVQELIGPPTEVAPASVSLALQMQVV